MTGEPLSNLGIFVGGIIIQDDRNDLAGRNRSLGGVEEANKLLMPMTLHAPFKTMAIVRRDGHADPCFHPMGIR